MNNIRNFAIIAHIDHGKSTLADRLLEITGTVKINQMQEQYLDSNPISRERGITIKLAPVRMEYQIPKNDFTLSETDWCTLNLIDTPGHVDFSYEVNRSLAACEGAILLVDATQGIQAQTVANYYLAKKQGLTIIPVINKIDMPGADIERTTRQIISGFGFSEEEILKISAKEGTGVEELITEIIKKIPSPKVDIQKPLRALVFDSFYDTHKGIIAYIRIVDGILKKTVIKLLKSGAVGKVEELGVISPERTPKDFLESGEVGYVATGIKNINLVKVGDTITEKETVNLVSPLPGYLEAKSMVFVGLYPRENQDFQLLREALAKLKLNDSSLSSNEEFSPSLGHGVRVGFLGILHAEIIQERLEREYNLRLIATTPTVEYKITNHGVTKTIQNASLFEPPVDRIEEPWTRVEILTPDKYLGQVMKLCEGKRGVYKDLKYLGKQVGMEEKEVILEYDLPLSEIITDFYNLLKSVSEGYASLDWTLSDYKDCDGVRLDIFINHEKIDAFSQIIVKERAEYTSRRLTEKLKEAIPRQQFEIPIQAAIGGKIIARETVPQFRKDVIQKLYGGDRTRKDKLLEAQKKGKKRMKQFGRVQIPQEAFLSIFKS